VRSTKLHLNKHRLIRRKCSESLSTIRHFEGRERLKSMRKITAIDEGIASATKMEDRIRRTRGVISPNGSNLADATNPSKNRQSSISIYTICRYCDMLYDIALCTTRYDNVDTHLATTDGRSIRQTSRRTAKSLASMTYTRFRSMDCRGR